MQLICNTLLHLLRTILCENKLGYAKKKKSTKAYKARKTKKSQEMRGYATQAWRWCYYTSESRCDKNYEIEVKFMENKKSINHMEYVLVGDCYIPDLKFPNEERSIGKYGRMHREYLRENNPMRFNDLVLSCQLWTYLADINEQTQDKLQIIISQMQKAESVTEKIKEDNQRE